MTQGASTDVQKISIKSSNRKPRLPVTKGAQTETKAHKRKIYPSCDDWHNAIILCKSRQDLMISSGYDAKGTVQGYKISRELNLLIT